jgi:hypothetical protein
MKDKNNKVQVGIDALLHVRRHSLYWDVTDEQLQGIYDANKKNVVGEAALNQITIRHALKIMMAD